MRSERISLALLPGCQAKLPDCARLSQSQAIFACLPTIHPAPVSQAELVFQVENGLHCSSSSSLMPTDTDDDAATITTVFTTAQGADAKERRTGA